MVGYLDITLGCMFSGKTKKLINNYWKYINSGKNAVAINHYMDTRYMENAICAHDLDHIPCLMIDDLYRAWFDRDHIYHDTIADSSHILINEAQFFDRLCEVVVSMVKCGKKVFIYGLDGDFKQQKFGEILDLIPYCDNVEKLRANCNYCENQGIFSKRLEDNNDQVLIGSNNYVPLCRKCFDKEIDLTIIEPVD